MTRRLIMKQKPFDELNARELPLGDPVHQLCELVDVVAWRQIVDGPDAAVDDLGYGLVAGRVGQRTDDSDVVVA